MPVMNPAMTAFDMKLEIQPIFASPATMNTSPAATANAAVNATAWVGLVALSPATTLADTAATEPAAA